MGFIHFGVGARVLRAAVIIDYQNMHTTGVNRFKPQAQPRDFPLNPLKFSTALVEFRNSKVTDAALLADLSSVEVYRGLPSSIHDPRDHATNVEQQKKWTQDPRVLVTHRNLKYDLAPSKFPDGTPKRYKSKVEKGIDVLCALAIIRNTALANVDLVIVASHDSDLEPAIEEALALARNTKIETVSWFNREIKNGRSQMNPKTPSPIWNTALGCDVFLASLDN